MKGLQSGNSRCTPFSPPGAAPLLQIWKAPQRAPTREGSSPSRGEALGHFPAVKDAERWSPGTSHYGPCRNDEDPAANLILIFGNCQAIKSKIFRLPSSANQKYKWRILGPHEGRFAIVTERRAGVVMDALASGVREHAGRKRRSVRPSRVVLTPRCWR